MRARGEGAIVVCGEIERLSKPLHKVSKVMLVTERVMDVNAVHVALLQKSYEFLELSAWIECQRTTKIAARRRDYDCAIRLRCQLKKPRLGGQRFDKVTAMSLGAAAATMADDQDHWPPGVCPPH
jgi:hypothetical protein